MWETFPPCRAEVPFETACQGLSPSPLATPALLVTSGPLNWVPETSSL